MLIQVQPHSFVDLITNSSSELFVCDVRKSLAAFKDILIAIAADLEEPISAEDLFTSIFNEPTICEYNFDLLQYPKFQEYQRVNSWNDRKKHPVHMACEEKQRLFRANNPQPKNDEAAEKVWYEQYHACDQEWDELEDKVRMEMLEWAFKVNNIPWTFKKPTGRRWARNGNDKFWDIARVFEDAQSWHYVLRKGIILLQSASDNSVPSELMDAIESTIPCKRYHQG